MVVDRLDPRSLKEVKKIVVNPPPENSYEILKTELVRRPTDSDTTRIRRLLEAKEIGDRTPTQFLRHLRRLAGPTVNEELVTEIWRIRLPIRTQEILAVTTIKEGLQLAEVADRIHDIATHSGRITQVAGGQAGGSQDEEPLHEVLGKLCSATLGNSRRRSGSRSTSRRSSRSPSRGDRGKRSTNGLCWYHEKWGEKAQKCKSGCNWL